MNFLQLLPIWIIIIAMIIVLYFFLRKENKPINENSGSAKKKRISKPIDVQLEIERLRLIMPLRIQASERLVLFLERIQPQQLVSRLLPEYSVASDLAQAMLSTIREEYEHNLSQQLFVSSTAWQLIRTAKEEITQFIHLSLSELHTETSPHMFAQRLLTHRFSDITELAIHRMRDELSLTAEE